MGHQICKFQLNDSKFLKYRPSMIAACAVIISINIYRRDKEKLEQSGVFSDDERVNEVESFFKFSPKQSFDGVSKILMNTDIWNNAMVVSVTGYTIEMLRKALFELSMFIR